MKKSLKLVAIFIGVLIVAIVGGLSGYFLITNNATYYIYDLRIVEPISNVNSFVYTDSESTYSSIKNKKVYMTSESENYFEIGIYAYTSNETRNVSLSSSDTSVARVVIRGSKCYVYYYKAGEANITVSIGSVQDSFKLTVYNQVADDFKVYDYGYYGKFATNDNYVNRVVAYADGDSYSYDYSVKAKSGEGYDLVNNDLLRIDTTSIDSDILSEVSLDATNQKLILKCNEEVKSNIDSRIIIQSYYYSDDGNVQVTGSYKVNVRVFAYTPEFLQIVLSTTPDFEDEIVFMDTEYMADKSDEDILDNIDNYVKFQKAERYLAENGETPVYHTYFTEKVSKLYIKFRMVYTNGIVEELGQDDFSRMVFTNSSCLTLSPNKEYYVMNVSSSDFVSGRFNIELSLKGYDLSHTFTFEYFSLSEANWEKFYNKNPNTGIYTYKYWDERTRYDNEIYDRNGNIIDIEFPDAT